MVWRPHYKNIEEILFYVYGAARLCNSMDGVYARQEYVIYFTVGLCLETHRRYIRNPFRILFLLLQEGYCDNRFSESRNPDSLNNSVINK